MNRSILITAMASVLLSFSLFSCEKEKPISPADLPVEITNYISTHFPDNKIIRAIEDKEGRTKNYEIYLDENFKLEFNSKLEIIEISGITRIPDSVVPERIRQYVTVNYPEEVIIGWELERGNQQVSLDNDLELEFTMSGDFLRID